MRSGLVGHFCSAACTLPAALSAAITVKTNLCVTLTALEHGCHVLGEKPLADSLAHAREMVAAAKQAGKIYAVIQNRRYLPQIRRLRNFLESGAIGELTDIADYVLGYRAKSRKVLDIARLRFTDTLVKPALYTQNSRDRHGLFSICCAPKFC